MTAPDQSPARYRIRIRGHLDPAWSTWFDSLTVTLEDDGTTELVGPLVDQGALFGLLARLRDLGATLLLVDRLQTGEPAGAPRRRQRAGGNQMGLRGPVGRGVLPGSTARSAGCGSRPGLDGHDHLIDLEHLTRIAMTKQQPR